MNNEKVKVHIEVSDCTECPYYYGMIRKGWVYSYGKCEKTGGIGENKNLIRNCPYKRKKNRKKIDEYIETDRRTHWKIHMADYIDDLIHERLEKILKE